ncbi:MAG: GTP-binding protein, partial [Chloroflexia bacterium]
MQTVSVLVTGARGSGKTQFVRTISDIGLVSTERRPAGEGAPPDARVVVDFGRFTMAPDLVLHLFGIPALQAVDFLWWVLCAEAVGWVILVDSTRPETFRDALKIADFLRSFRAS